MFTIITRPMTTPKTLPTTSRLARFSMMPKDITMQLMDRGRRNSSQWKIVRHSTQMDLFSLPVDENWESSGCRQTPLRSTPAMRNEQQHHPNVILRSPKVLRNEIVSKRELCGVQDHIGSEDVPGVAVALACCPGSLAKAQTCPKLRHFKVSSPKSQRK